MPVPAVAYSSSPAEMRRLAWSLVMAKLREMEEGDCDAEQVQILLDGVQSSHDLGTLVVVLMNLVATLWAGQHNSLADASSNAREVALTLAEQQ